MPVTLLSFGADLGKTELDTRSRAIVLAFQLLGQEHAKMAVRPLALTTLASSFVVTEQVPMEASLWGMLGIPTIGPLTYIMEGTHQVDAQQVYLSTAWAQVQPLGLRQHLHPRPQQAPYIHFL